MPIHSRARDQRENPSPGRQPRAPDVRSGTGPLPSGPNAVLTPADVLQLQRAIGNGGVVRLLGRAPHAPPPVQRAAWQTTDTANIGFTFGTLSRVARQQHTPETCWAAALAMASALRGNGDWNNELRWYHTARRAGLVMEGSTRILPENLQALVGGIRGFRIGTYSMGGVAPMIGQVLAGDGVILLMSPDHVVLLGQLQLDRTTNAITYYHVIDSGTGNVESWSQAEFNAFQPEYAAVVS